MPGECIANSRFVEVFRQGKCTKKELDVLKMLVVEVGINRITKSESYRLCTVTRQEGLRSRGIRLMIGDQRTL